MTDDIDDIIKFDDFYDLDNFETFLGFDDFGQGTLQILFWKPLVLTIPIS